MLHRVDSAKTPTRCHIPATRLQTGHCRPQRVSRVAQRSDRGASCAFDRWNTGTHDFHHAVSAGNEASGPQAALRFRKIPHTGGVARNARETGRMFSLSQANRTTFAGSVCTYSQGVMTGQQSRSDKAE
jgi:hypothetical protein